MICRLDERGTTECPGRIALRHSFSFSHLGAPTSLGMKFEFSKMESFRIFIWEFRVRFSYRIFNCKFRVRVRILIVEFSKMEGFRVRFSCSDSDTETVSTIFLLIFRIFLQNLLNKLKFKNLQPPLSKSLHHKTKTAHLRISTPTPSFFSSHFRWFSKSPPR